MALLTHSGRTNCEGCHNQKAIIRIIAINQKKNWKFKYKDFLRIVDGDTIYIGKKKYRFSGIDAPEIKQTCEKEGVYSFVAWKQKKF